MKLLPKNDYNIVEELLRVYNICATMEEPYKRSMEEIIEFFNVPIYKDFLEKFYLTRYEYLNRYTDNRSMIRYLCSILYVSEDQLYKVRREIIYKSAMVFYKNNLLKGDN